ncbi:MAG TPA: AI-2E family transporter [Ilumatobacteraceae bacterium]|nr:AI-2E family transporter [Ilumatobacteraceae bacterium]
MFIGTVLALAVITVMIAATRDLTIPLAIGIFLAIVFAPFVDWLEDRGIKRGAGAGIVLVGLVAVIVGCGWITAEALYSQGDALTENLQGAVEEVKTWVEDLPISAAAVDEVDSTAHDAAPVARDGVATAVATLFDSAAGMIAGLVLGAMVLYYILKDGATLTRKWVDRKADPARRDAAERVIDKSVNDIQSYFGGQTALALVNGVSIALGMYFLGVPGALAVGVVNFVGAYIPYIGAFFGGAFAVLMALGDGGVGLALAALAVVLVAQVVLENLLQPKLLGTSLNLHPLTILLATTLGGMIAGMVGLILAAPVLAIGLDLSRELKAVGFFNDQPAGHGGAPGSTPDTSTAALP